MPIPAPPTKSTCTLCGWSTVTKHRSDVIFLPKNASGVGVKKLNTAKQPAWSELWQ